MMEESKKRRNKTHRNSGLYVHRRVARRARVRHVKQAAPIVQYASLDNFDQIRTYRAAGVRLLQIVVFVLRFRCARPSGLRVGGQSEIEMEDESKALGV